MEKLQASSLFYALLIAVLLATMSSGLIALSVFNKMIGEKDSLERKLNDNANSGLNVLLAEDGYYPIAVDLDLFGKARDSVSLKKMKWGLFDVLISTAFHTTVFKKETKVKSAIVGTVPDGWEKSALYLVDQNKSLILAGETAIIGDAYRPKSGIKPGIVNGINYQGGLLVHGKELDSQAELPALDFSRWEELDVWKSSEIQKTLFDTIHSYKNETLVFKDSIFLIDQKIKGNCLVVADSLIYVDANAQLENIILKAPYIVFANGFIGNVQAFANKELIVESDCQFQYPSVLSLMKNDETSYRGEIEIGENTTLAGMIIIGKKVKHPSKPKLVMNKNSLVNGQVYVDGLVDIKGAVHGNLACNSFYLRAGPSSYTNHLLDVRLNAKKRSKAYLSPMYLKNEKRKTSIAKWKP